MYTTGKNKIKIQKYSKQTNYSLKQEKKIYTKQQKQCAENV